MKQLGKPISNEESRFFSTFTEHATLMGDLAVLVAIVYQEHLPTRE
jgi:hypothetical protein